MEPWAKGTILALIFFGVGAFGSRIDGKLRVLDFKLAEVRAKVLDHSDARVAYDDAAVGY